MSAKDGKKAAGNETHFAGFWPTVSARCPYDDGFDGCQLKKRLEPCVCERLARCPYDDGFDGCQLKKRLEPCVCERLAEAAGSQ